MLNIRKRDENPQGTIGWCPQFDLRNTGIDAVRRAVAGLAKPHWEPWFSEYVELSGVSEADLGAACEQFTRAFANYLKGDADDFGKALEEAGFYTSHKACQLAIFGRLGQVYMGHICYAIKTATHEEGQASPLAPAIARVEEGARALAEALIAMG